MIPRIREDGLHMVERISLVERLATLTGWTDNDIASLLGMARSTVQAYRSGRLEENLTEKQREVIVKGAREYRDQVYQAVAEIELYA